MKKCEECGKKIGLLAVRYTWVDKKNNRAVHDKCSDLSRKKRIEQEPTKILKETEQDIDSRSILEPVTKFEKAKEKKNNKIVKISIILAIIIILLNVVSAGGYFILDQSYSELTEEKQDLEDKLTTTQNNLNNTNHTLALTETELEQVNNSLQENNSELQQLESGDKYHLHDPTWNEVLEFLENNNETDIQKMIDNAKNLGLRCAYVTIGMEMGMLELIGFYTLDYDMVYLEPTTYYLVYPKVGSNYYDCVENQPYGPSTPEYNDKIFEILIVW